MKELETPDRAAYQSSVAKGLHPAMLAERFRPGETRDTGDVFEALENLRTWLDGIQTWMGEERSRFEPDWRYTENEYRIARERAIDENRSASVFQRDPDASRRGRRDRDAELALPVGFEAVEQAIPRDYEAMLGSDPDAYVTVIGREANDEERSRGAQEFLNYQQGWEIDTPIIWRKFIRNARMYGIGILGQLWDFEANTRRVEVCSPWDVWFDPGATGITDCRYIRWRRRVTVGDVLDRIRIGAFAINPEAVWDIVAAATVGEELANPTHVGVERDETREIQLDIYMEPDRWIYVLADTLIVAVVSSQVPPIRDSQGQPTRWTFPIHIYVPLPEVDEEESPKSVYGLSTLVLGRSIIDMQNSITYLMHKGLARSALGVYFGDPSAMTNPVNGQIELKAGSVFPVRDPRNNMMVETPPDPTGVCLNALGNLDVRMERLSGVNNAIRGQANYATETAYAKQQDLGQATYRFSLDAKMGISAMRHYWDVALRLNQEYLEPTEFIRVVGEKAAWHPFSNEDLQAVSGKDLVPTGMPLSANRQAMAQMGLNLIPLMQQLKAGGMADLDVRRVLRDTLVSLGFRGVEQVVPPAINAGRDPQQENELILQGIPVEVTPNDNHENHYHTHLAMFYDPDARLILKENGAALSGFEAHLAKHAAYLEPESGQPASSSGDGMGAGMGVAGQNLNPAPSSRPKPTSELMSQVEGSG
jgi:hypothetical protein